MATWYERNFAIGKVPRVWIVQAESGTRIRRPFVDGIPLRAVTLRFGSGETFWWKLRLDIVTDVSVDEQHE